MHALRHACKSDLQHACVSCCWQQISRCTCKEISSYLVPQQDRSCLHLFASNKHAPQTDSSFWPSPALRPHTGCLALAARRRARARLACLVVAAQRCHFGVISKKIYNWIILTKIIVLSLKSFFGKNFQEPFGPPVKAILKVSMPSVWRCQAIDQNSPRPHAPPVYQATLDLLALALSSIELLTPNNSYLVHLLTRS